MTVLDSSVLVLNRFYQPINITTVRRAFALLYQGTAKAIDREYKTFDFESWAALSAEVHPDGDEDIVKTVSSVIRVPQSDYAAGVRPSAADACAFFPPEHLSARSEHMSVLR